MKITTSLRAGAIAMALSVSVLLAASARSLADAPRICYVTSGGGTSVVIGDGFDSSSRVIVWNAPSNPNDLIKNAADLKGPAVLPASPPADAKEIDPVNVTNDQVLNVVLPDSPMVVWVRTAAGISPPRLVNAPQIYLVTDDQPAPGDQMRIFGRNFCLGYLNDQTTPDRIVLFRSASTGQITIARTAALSEQDWQHTDDHVIGVLVPEGLAAGPYDILVHAADSGALGWSAPYRIEITPHRGLAATFSRPDEPSPGPVSVIRVTGASGDGARDDTRAIQSALDQAVAAGGGVALLPPGEFAITRTLHISPGVILRGSGAQATSIIVSPNLPMQGGPGTERNGPSYDRGFLPPMIWIETKSGVSDLSLIGGPESQIAIYVTTNGVSEDVSIVRTNISTPERMFRVGNGAGGYQYLFGIMVRALARHLTIVQCHVKCGEPLWLDPGKHDYCTITDNTFDAYPRQGSDNGCMSSMTHSVIEDNDFTGGSRAMVISGGLENSWIFNNRVTDDGGWANAEEMFLSEYSASLWGGACQSATADTIQAQGAHFTAGQFTDRDDPVFVYIKIGKGFGQMRKVTANTADTLTVDTPWDVVPDTTTRFSILPFTYRNLYINDQAIHCNGRCEFAFGSMTECVISGLNTRDCEGASGSACDCGVVCFNDYSYNRLIGLSGIHLQGDASYDTGIMTIPGVDVGEGRRGNVIGNTIRYNEVMNFKQYALNQYDNWWGWMRPLPTEEAGISVSDGSFNVIDDNYVTNGAVGVHVNGGESNLVINNRIDDVLTAIRDLSRNTFVAGNKTALLPAQAGAPAR